MTPRSTKMFDVSFRRHYWFNAHRRCQRVFVKDESTSQQLTAAPPSANNWNWQLAWLSFLSNCVSGVSRALAVPLTAELHMRAPSRLCAENSLRACPGLGTGFPYRLLEAKICFSSFVVLKVCPAAWFQDRASSISHGPSHRSNVQRCSKQLRAKNCPRSQGYSSSPSLFLSMDWATFFAHTVSGESNV